MTWGSFLGFWSMRELGQEDAVFRNYDLLKFAGREGRQDTYIWLALKRLGWPVAAKDAVNYIPEVAQRLADYGVPKPDFDKVRVRLLAWYTWDRIRKGDISQWFKKETEK